MAQILKAPSEVLSQKAQPVEKIDQKVRKIIEEMMATLNAQENPKGVGLAAPQIGYSLQIFITKPALKSPIRIFINPEIIGASKELTNGVPERENLPAGRHDPLEGCLSLPGIWGPVKRHASLKLRYQTPNGQTHKEEFKGFLATIIQHEIDHLGGRLFTQRVLEQKGKLYRAGKNKEGKEVLKEIEI